MAIAPPLLDRVTRGSASPGTGTRHPFGLSRAVPANPKDTGWVSGLRLCPERQITVGPDGQPFIYNPAMKSEFVTSSETEDDGLTSTDTENDTD